MDPGTSTLQASSHKYCRKSQGSCDLYKQDCTDTSGIQMDCATFASNSSYSMWQPFIWVMLCHVAWKAWAWPAAPASSLHFAMGGEAQDAHGQTAEMEIEKCRSRNVRTAMLAVFSPRSKCYKTCLSTTAKGKYEAADTNARDVEILKCVQSVTV